MRIHRFATTVDDLGGCVAGLDGIVDAVGGPRSGKSSRMGQEELPDGRIQGEPVDAGARGIDKHRARPVQHVPGGHLGGARLEESAS